MSTARSKGEKKKSVTLCDVVEQKRIEGKVPVLIGDSNNTIIFIAIKKNKKQAKLDFLSKLDPYNPARPEIEHAPKPQKAEKDPDAPTEHIIKAKNRNRDFSTF